MSVGLPVYNAERFVAAALGALLAQDIDDLEVIVADNASTDGTEAVVREAAGGDPRVRYVRADVNHGAARNFNWTFELARGRFFKWAAHDDLTAPSFLRRCVEELEADPSLALVHPQSVDIDDDGEVIHHWGPLPMAQSPEPADRLRDVLTVNHRAFPIFGVARRTVLAQTSLIRPFALSDLLTLGELALIGPWREVPEALFLHREHEGRSTRAYASKEARAAWFATDRAGRAALPHWELLAGYLRATARTDMSVAQRARALRVVTGWSRQSFRVLGHEAKVALRRPRRGVNTGG